MALSHDDFDVRTAIESFTVEPPRSRGVRHRLLPEQHLNVFPRPNAIRWGRPDQPYEASNRNELPQPPAQPEMAAGWAGRSAMPEPAEFAQPQANRAEQLTYLQSFQRGLNQLILICGSSVPMLSRQTAPLLPTNGVIVVRVTEPLLAGVDLPDQPQAQLMPPCLNNRTFQPQSCIGCRQYTSILQRTCVLEPRCSRSHSRFQSEYPISGLSGSLNDGYPSTWLPNKNSLIDHIYGVCSERARQSGNVN